MRDLTGQTFGKWKVLREAPYRQHKYYKAWYWLCRCACGQESEINDRALIRQQSKGCHSCAAGEGSRHNTRIERQNQMSRFWLSNPKNTEMPAAECRRLWACVLEEALKAVRGYGLIEKRDEKEKQLAEEWFDDDNLRAYGFLWVCEVLDLDPEMVRGHIRKKAA